MTQRQLYICLKITNHNSMLKFTTWVWCLGILPDLWSGVEYMGKIRISVWRFMSVGTSLAMITYYNIYFDLQRKTIEKFNWGQFTMLDVAWLFYHQYHFWAQSIHMIKADLHYFGCLELLRLTKIVAIITEAFPTQSSLFLTINHESRCK